MTRVVVLGRFQPFHRGHAAMLSAALTRGEVCVAIGSSNKPQDLQNPWTAEERTAMIQTWLDAEGHTAELVAVPDIDDPPNWVTHATQYHGEGMLYTTDAGTADLYRAAGWEVEMAELEQRTDWEGWRIRATMQMLSTVPQLDAVIETMSVNIPRPVAELIVNEGWQRRLLHMGTGGEPVG